MTAMKKKEREKSKLMKVCVNHTRSALKKNCTNVKLTNDSSSSTGDSTGNDSDSDNWKKIPADVRKKSSNNNPSAGSHNKKKAPDTSTNDSSGSESLL